MSSNHSAGPSGPALSPPHPLPEPIQHLPLEAGWIVPDRPLAVEPRFDGAVGEGCAADRHAADVLDCLIDPVALLVTRRDKLAAAISQHRAERTGEWSSGGQLGDVPRLPGHVLVDDLSPASSAWSSNGRRSCRPACRCSVTTGTATSGGAGMT